MEVVEQLWFLNTWITVWVSFMEGTDGLSVLEHRAPWGDSPPLHIHRTVDEIFQVFEGRIRLVMGGTERECGPGAIVLMPRGVPHTHRVESEPGGHWITVTAQGDFEKFVRSISRPAWRPGLPGWAGPPTPEAAVELGARAADFGIPLVGPPLR